DHNPDHRSDNPAARWRWWLLRLPKLWRRRPGRSTGPCLGGPTCRVARRRIGPSPGLTPRAYSRRSSACAIRVARFANPGVQKEAAMAEAPSVQALTALAVVMSLVEALVKRGVIDQSALDATLKNAGTNAQALCADCSREVEREV